MALKICSLGSGSKGNTVYIENASGAYLIDCGLSVSEIREGLSAIGRTLDKVNGILVTHEHIDHIKSAAVLAEGFGIPVYAHEKTFCALRNMFGKKLKNAATFQTFCGFTLNDLDIIPFFNSHDVFTVGYSIRDKDSRLVYATDLGAPSQEMVEIAKGCDLVMLESNYDPFMLTNGRYPYYLKRRIASAKGHLSNGVCAEVLKRIHKSGTKNIILGHLSEENNLPELAGSATKEALYSEGAMEGQDYHLYIATQRTPTAFIEVTGKK